MKRTALTRRTPLRSSSLPSMPLGSRPEPLRRSSIAKVSPKRARANRARVVAEKQLGREALGGTCARCGHYGYVNGHERLGRAQGGCPAAPDALLCRSCNGWAEDEPIAAAWDGWKISRKHPHDPRLYAYQGRRVDGTLVDFTTLSGAA